MPEKRRSRRSKNKIVKKNCIFCKEKTNPTYREVEALRRYVTERGKLIPMSRTGICSKHQRKLTLAVKHARHIALLPYIVRPY